MPDLFVFILVLSTISFVVTDEGVDIAKVLIMKREIPRALEALKGVIIQTPENKIQFANMATEFAGDLSDSLYLSNTMIASVADVAVANHSNFVVSQMSKFIRDIYQALPGESEYLKRTLVTFLEDSKELLDNFAKNINGAITDPFLLNQMRRKHNCIIYGLQKLTRTSLLFHKTNKELAAGFRTSYYKLAGTLNALPLTKKTDVDEFRHAIELVSFLTAKIVYRLENWVEINTNNTEGVTFLREVTEDLSELFDKEIRAIDTTRKASVLRRKLLEAMENGLKLAKLAGETEMLENGRGSLAFIRGSLLDAATLGYALSDIIGESLTFAQPANKSN